MSQPSTPRRRANGSLIIVGVGIGLAGQCTIEARNAIEAAEEVLSLAGDRLVQQWLEGLNSNVRSLHGFYDVSPNRAAAYEAIAEAILAPVRLGKRVCAVFYGHPGVFVTPSHAAMAKARAENFHAKMLPAVSAEDCLFADLGVDPGAHGCQSYEARDFLITKRRIDPRAALILWQIAVVGDGAFVSLSPDPTALGDLACALMQIYPDNHPVTVYAAQTLPFLPPEIETLPLHQLALAHVDQASTLYVPPLQV